MTMTDFQSLFAIFFAIFWGTISNSWPTRKPFNWPLYDYSPVRRRLVLSVLLLNVVPLLYFSFVFGFLGQVTGLSKNVLLAIIPAFAVFGFYRIWLGITELKANYFYFAEKDYPPKLAATKPSIEPYFEANLPAETSIRNIAIGIGYVIISSIPLALVILK